MTFSTNQVRHLYVAKTFVAGAKPNTLTEGQITLGKTNDGDIYFSYKGKDSVLRSDLINKGLILSAAATDASKMAITMKSFEVTLDNTINGGNPVAGQDYLLRIYFDHYIGMSDQDQYIKEGVVRGHSTMKASDFYKKLALSLALNFVREPQQLLKFELKTATGKTEVTALTKEASLTDTYTAVVITEVPQDWRRGITEQVPVYFSVVPTTINVLGEELIWGKATAVDSGVTVSNGRKTADLEYFCMGDRGDVYRGMAWPNNIVTEYMVDNVEQGYHYLDIHYAYVESNESPQKSEKDLTIACATKAELNKIVDALNSATGLTVAKLA